MSERPSLPIAESDMGGDQQSGKPEAEAQVLSPGQQSGSGEHEHGKRVDADDADGGHRLHQQRHRHDAVADRVPRKAGEQDATQPLGSSEGSRERGDAADVGRPGEPRRSAGRAIEQRQECRQGGHRERNRPGEAFGLDQQCVAHPPQAGNEIAEAEPPADRKRRQGPLPQRSVGFGRCPVKQPDQHRKRDETGGEKVERRLGQHCNCAGQERRQRAPPAPQQNDPAGQALHASTPRISGPDLSGRRRRSKRCGSETA